MGKPRKRLNGTQEIYPVVLKNPRIYPRAVSETLKCARERRSTKRVPIR